MGAGIAANNKNLTLNRESGFPGLNNPGLSPKRKFGSMSTTDLRYSIKRDR